MQGYSVCSATTTPDRRNRGKRVDLVVLTQPVAADRLDELRVLCGENEVGLERLHFVLDQLVVPS
jgi:hypothetical protein